VSPVRLTLLVVCLVVPAVAGADGTVALYLQPIPSEAARLTFSLDSVSAVAANGSEYPLKLRVKQAGQAETTRQRLLASGSVPPGSYVGFAFTVRQAALKGEPREVALVVPGGPVRLDVPFAVTGQQGVTFWLALKYQEPVTGGLGFSPLFSAVAPPRPIADHAGFVSNSVSNTITVFDKHLLQAVAVIDTCAGPAGMAFDERRRRVYVACSKDDEIQAIDVATGDVIERTRTSPGDRPREIALAADGSTLLSVNPGSGSVSFFDAASLTRKERVDVGSGPGSVLIDPSGRRAFVFNALSSSISVIDIPSRSVVGSLSTDSGPLRGQFNARGDRLYVIHDRSPYMTVVDPRQLTTVTRARLRIGVSAIAVDRVRDLVCIGGSNDSTIEFYDPNALMPLYSMRTRSGVVHLTIDAAENSLYMVSPDRQSIVVGRLADRKVVSEIDVGDGPYWVALAGEK
jgi:DNA-binding beta-propeller fold protein YncE